MMFTKSSAWLLGCSAKSSWPLSFVIFHCSLYNGEANSWGRVYVQQSIYINVISEYWWHWFVSPNAMNAWSLCWDSAVYRDSSHVVLDNAGHQWWRLSLSYHSVPLRPGWMHSHCHNSCSEQSLTSQYGIQYLVSIYRALCTTRAQIPAKQTSPPSTRHTPCWQNPIIILWLMDMHKWAQLLLMILFFPCSIQPSPQGFQLYFFGWESNILRLQS